MAGNTPPPAAKQPRERHQRHRRGERALRSGDAFTPSCGNFTGDAAAAALARRPLPQSMPQLFVANTDVGPQFCWATGALIVAEKILQAELGVSAPSWLNATWYEQRVVAQP